MNLYDLHSKPESIHGYENRVSNVAKLAYDHAMQTGKRFPEGEKAIASNMIIAYEYAKKILKGPFPQGEKAISRDPNYALSYALRLGKKQMPMAEPSIIREIQKISEHGMTHNDLEFVEEFLDYVNTYKLTKKYKSIINSIKGQYEDLLSEIY